MAQFTLRFVVVVEIKAVHRTRVPFFSFRSFFSVFFVGFPVFVFFDRCALGAPPPPAITPPPPPPSNSEKKTSTIEKDLFGEEN